MRKRDIDTRLVFVIEQPDQAGWPYWLSDMWNVSARRLPVVAPPALRNFNPDPESSGRNTGIPAVADDSVAAVSQEDAQGGGRIFCFSASPRLAPGLRLPSAHKEDPNERHRSPTL